MAAYIAWLRIPVAITSGLAASLSGLLYWKQNELIYPRAIPTDARTNVPRPQEFADEYDFDSTEEVFIPTPDGEKLSAFLLKPRKRKYTTDTKDSEITVLMFHGNAGNIGHRIPVAGVFQLSVPCNILMIEYRGYGLSTGTPDENGINIDSQAALDFVLSRDDLKETGLVIYGQSLGGAVAIEMAYRNMRTANIKALILENTFLSIRKLIPTAFPPAKYIVQLCHQYWNSEEVLPKIKDIPILFLAGVKDEIVPHEHMKRLYEVCTAPIKEFKTYPRGSHNSTVTCPGYFDDIADFMKNHVDT